MDTKGGKLRWGGDGGVLNWAIGIDMYILMCIKLVTDLKKKKKNTMIKRGKNKLNSEHGKQLDTGKLNVQI